jgi:hypothetical protein
MKQFEQIMKTSQKRFILILIGFMGFTCIAALVWNYFRYFNSPERQALMKAKGQPACADTVKPPDSANIAYWQTYYSEQYGFEIKYPGGQQLISDAFRPYYYCGSRQQGDLLSIALTEGALGGTSTAVGYDITVYSNPQKLNARDFALCKMQYKYRERASEIKINSVDNIIIGEQAIAGTKVTFNDPTVMVVIPSGENIIEIEWSRGARNLTAKPSDLDKMLSTFKFVSKANNSQSIEKLEILPPPIYENDYGNGSKAVVYANNVTKVEFRHRGPSAGNYTDSEGFLVGVGEKVVGPDGQERWEMLMPSNDHCWFDTLCALGYDAQGKKIGEKCLYNVNDISLM